MHQAWLMSMILLGSEATGSHNSHIIDSQQESDVFGFLSHKCPSFWYINIDIKIT